MLTTPTISLVVPARDEGARVAQTVAAAIEACQTPRDLEVVIVDDCSTPAARPQVSTQVRQVPVRVVRSDRHLGVGAARNLAVRNARGDAVFITDAHVRLSAGWDQEVQRMLAPRRILAATICKEGSGWRSFGCHAVVPYMGTYWNTRPPDSAPFVQIASSAGTVLERALFEQIGGYDEGMVHYGGFEPEFSIRAWRSGAEIVLAPGIEVAHRFKTDDERVQFTAAARTAMTHNCLRFGVAHLPELMILEMVRLHAMEFPDHIQPALRLLEQRGAWRRREELAATLPRGFAWFVDRFALRDQLGAPIPSEHPVPGSVGGTGGADVEVAVVAAAKVTLDEGARPSNTAGDQPQYDRSHAANETPRRILG